ncbi:hypothetical protein DICVIV_06439 [Dictyocaulus viviparus]|uniref:Uncharacterized protein n=1 Tax=Dictyocaulus viviparus TaxID=29172 RepID=A0A0D8XYR7_DICVI|nr:hypothetical protein DICVIV_06439 [Dictyocaulus viviparus]
MQEKALEEAKKYAKKIPRSVEAKTKSSHTSDSRNNAGLPMSARAMNDEFSGSDYDGFEGGAKRVHKVQEGGIGSIMRDPDLDSCTKPEKASVSRMVYKSHTWITVDKIPSDMSFEIPSDST